MTNAAAPDRTANAVAQAAINSGKSRLQVVAEAAIPGHTFYRKLTSGGGGFNWDELLRIPEAAGVHPGTFTPSAFQGAERVPS